MSPPPTVLSLVVADGVHRDARGLGYILGVFHTYFSSRFPMSIPQVSVYIALTDARGKMRLTLRFIDGEDENEQPIVRSDIDVTFPGPLEVVTVCIDFKPLPLPAPGVYRWQLLCEGEVIADQRFNVIQRG